MSKLQQGVVIDVPSWKVPVISRKKYLKQPEISVDIRVPTDDLKAMPDKQFKAFEAEFEKRFAPAFQKMSGAWFADMQKSMDQTEELLEASHAQIQKLAKKDEASALKVMEPVITKRNATLMDKAKDWAKQAQKVAQDAYDAAFEAALKAMKLKITKAKAKMIAKVVFLVALTLTAAALTIAVSVVTAGVGAAIAPLVLAGIVAAGKALFGSVSEVIKSYDVLATTITALETDTKDVKAAVTAYAVAAQKTAGTMDRVKAFKAGLTASVTSLDKHAGQLDKFAAVAVEKTSKRLKEIQALADSLAKSKSDSPEAKQMEKDVLTAQKSFDGAMTKLKKIDEARAAAKEVKEAFQKSDAAMVAKALGKFGPVLDFLKSAAALGKEAATPIAAIAKAIPKLA
ncbi:MAG: hypothetical protein JWP52_3053 [Rhizobacter sp.]|nr:hypothetical protein [Rhizobacter sp.]